MRAKERANTLPIILTGVRSTLAYGKYVHEYQKSAVNGASPLQLIVMLYDGALRLMEGGKHAMAQKDLEKQNSNLIRAQKIFTELISCLDMEKGGEIARNLLGLYGFCVNQLVEANIYDRTENIDVCIRIMSDLRESWVTLEQQSKTGAGFEVPLAA